MGRRSHTRSLRLAVLAAGLAACVAGPAAAVYEPLSLSRDLDGDGDTDTVRTVDASGDGPLTAVNISDECGDGSTTDVRVTGAQDSLARLKLYPADTRPGREVFVDLRSGAAGRVGEARLVGWRPPSGASTCPRPRTLFRYRSTNPSSPPRGASENSSFAAAVRNVERRFAGREVILDEFYVTEEIPAGCCPSFRKRRFFRYSSSSDKYVRYRTQVTRLSPQS